MKNASLAIALAMTLPASSVGQTPLSIPSAFSGAPVAEVAEQVPRGEATLPEASADGSSNPSALTSLTDFEELALNNHPALARAAANVRSARGQWLQEGLYPNPRIGYDGSEIGNEGRAGMQGAFAGQEIVTGNKLGLNRAIAAQEIREAEQQLEAERYRVLNNVRARFYDMQIAERAVELAEQLDTIGEQSTTTAARLYKAQQSSLNDVLQARIEWNTAKITLENARNEQTAAWQRLAAAAGVPELAQRPLQGDIAESKSEITWQAALDQILATSPELAAAQARIERGRWAVQRACVEPVPNLDVVTAVQYDNASRDTFASVMVGIPVPLWNRNQGGILRAQSELAAAQAEVPQIELDLTNRLALAYARYANARYQVKQYETLILPDAKSSIDIVTKGYQQGAADFLNLLTAQRTYVQTNLMYLESLRQLRRSEVEIQGLLLTTENPAAMK